MMKRSVREALLNRRSSGLHHGFILMLILAACSFSAPATAEDLAPSQVQSADIPATFTLVGDLKPGEPGHLAVSWRGKEATELTIWIDFNNDDEWSDDEIVANNRPVEPGIEVIQFPVPRDRRVVRRLHLRYRFGYDLEFSRTNAVLNQSVFLENKVGVTKPYQSQFESPKRSVEPNLTTIDEAPEAMERTAKLASDSFSAATVTCAWDTGLFVDGADDMVMAMVPFDTGTGFVLVAGGWFRSVDGVTTSYIGQWDGTTWSALGGGLNDTVLTMETFNGSLYVGGLFTEAGGAPANHIARWDGSSWSPLGSGTNNTVRDLEVFNGELVVVGDFSTAGGIAVDNIAKWNGTSWADVGSASFIGGPTVLKVFDDGGGSGPALFVGGWFVNVNGISVGRVAKWDGTTWSSVGSGFDDQTVYSFAVYDGALYAGGSFSASNGTPVSRVARWDGVSWTPLGSGLNGSTKSMVVGPDGALYVGGAFTVAGGQPAARSARWDGMSWSALGSGFETAVNSLTTIDLGVGATLVAGGFFETADGLPAARVASWDGASWSAVSSHPGGQGTDDEIEAFAVFDDGSGPRLYAGGSFSVAGNVVARGIARWNGVSWEIAGGGLDGRVSALASDSAYLYAGGDFSLPGLASTNRVARWDGHTWTQLGSNFDNKVKALAFYDDGSGPLLYAGGDFTYHFAHWDGSFWSYPVYGLNGGVSALLNFDDGSGNALFVAGNFGSGDWTTTSGIARWDGSNWTALGTGIGLGGYALAAYNDGSGNALYAGGQFSKAGGISANNIAKWDGTSWSALGTGTDSFVSSMAVFDGGAGSELFVSGQFLTPGEHLARWNGISWAPVGTGLSGRALAIITFDDGSGPDLYLGGVFELADGSPSTHFGRWSCTCSSSTDLTANEWQMIGLPCSPTGTTIGDIFGDDLAQADYDSRWVMYEWDRASEQYTKLGLSSALHQGPGYWIRTLDGGQTIDVNGSATATSCSESPAFSVIGCFSETLNGSSTGRWNMIGHPLSYAVNWGDVRFVDDSGNEWTPSEAEIQGVASKNMYTWNGSAYQTWDDATPGMLGTLGVFEGQWVKAFPTATALRIPAMPASGGTTAPARNFEESEWMIRLTATSDDLSDPGNVFGQLAGSTAGLDTHDLPELAPFSTRYLTVVFPHPKWHTDAWAYTTDFHGIPSHLTPGTDKGRTQRWEFEIRSGNVGNKVSLSWQGPNKILKRSILVIVKSPLLPEIQKKKAPGKTIHSQQTLSP